MNPKIRSSIQGYEKVVDKVGHWPDFHDAECIEMLLQRTKDEAEIGPTLTAKFHVMEAPPGGTDKHYLVTLKFFTFERLVLEEFSYQNAINGLDVEERSSGRTSQRKPIQVTIHDAGGVRGSFNCSHIKVVDIEDFVPPEEYW
jgi:immunity protein 50 of polymorphic toxin system